MKRKVLIGIVLLLLILNGCNDNESSNSLIFESDTLKGFYEELFVKVLEMRPEFIDDLGDLSEYGVPFQKEKLTDSSDQYYIEMESLLQEALERIDTYSIADDYDSYINKANVKWYILNELENIKYRNNIFLLSSMIGEQRSLYDLLFEIHVVENVKDAEDLVKRFEASGEKIRQLIERYNTNAANGYVMDPVNVDSTLSQISGMYQSNIDRMDLYKEFGNKIEKLNLPGDESGVLLKKAYDALESSFVPAMEELKQALLDSKDLSDEPLGVWSQPDGEAYYIHALKQHTTTDMTPEEIHRLGLSEVGEIRRKMSVYFEILGYKGDLADMLRQLYQKEIVFTGEEAMSRYKNTAAEMEKRLGEFFHQKDLPESSPDIRVSSRGDYYFSPSIDGKRPGVFYLDVGEGHYDMDINTLAYHETVPGHHLQIEHDLQLENIPMIRKIAYYTSYIEGWALYAEMLADENEFNDTPERHIGYLKSELHRAVRLVVDTGIHYKKWSRGQAVDYLVDEGLLDPDYARDEVTRYTSWPGQACSYKIGQLKILELRDLAEEELGDKFVIKDFHSAILSNGSMPLELLEEQVKMYIEKNQ